MNTFQNMTVQDEVQLLAEAAESLASVTDEASAQRARALLADALRLRKTIKAEHETEKRPHLEAGRAVDAKWGALSNAVTEAEKPINLALTQWMQAEQARRDALAAEARRIAAEEAAKAAALAAAAEADDGDNLFAGSDALTAEQAARDAAIKAQAAAAESRVRVADAEGNARAASLRKTWSVEVTDGPALVMHYAKSRTLIDEAARIATAAVRAAKGDAAGIPGIRVIETVKVQ
jgi:hypothetical protein